MARAAAVRGRRLVIFRGRRGRIRGVTAVGKVQDSAVFRDDPVDEAIVPS
jgi:hypothetical protein